MGYCRLGYERLYRHSKDCFMSSLLSNSLPNLKIRLPIYLTSAILYSDIFIVRIPDKLTLNFDTKLQFGRANLPNDYHVLQYYGVSAPYQGLCSRVLIRCKLVLFVLCYLVVISLACGSGNSTEICSNAQPCTQTLGAHKVVETLRHEFQRRLELFSIWPNF